MRGVWVGGCATALKVYAGWGDEMRGSRSSSPLLVSPLRASGTPPVARRGAKGNVGLGNLAHYGTLAPPTYNLSKWPAGADLAIVAGTADKLADPADVQVKRLIDRSASFKNDAAPCQDDDWPPLAAIRVTAITLLVVCFTACADVTDDAAMHASRTTPPRATTCDTARADVTDDAMYGRHRGRPHGACSARRRCSTRCPRGSRSTSSRSTAGDTSTSSGASSPPRPSTPPSSSSRKRRSRRPGQTAARRRRRRPTPPSPPRRRGGAPRHSTGR